MQRRCRKVAFANGDLATIFRTPLGGRPYIEGRATILRPLRGVSQFEVLFDGEVSARRRFVHEGDFQNHPARVLRALTDLWRASIDPALLSDFDFPNQEEKS